VESRTSIEPPLVFTEIGVHADVEITLAMDRSGGEMALIDIGHEGHTRMTFADVDSLERLAAVAVEGARQLQERIDARKRPPASSTDAGASVATEVA
jgi:hypothetical protein